VVGESTGRASKNATLPQVVPPGLVVGWNATKVVQSKGLVEVTLDGATTFDREEVIARLQAEGCHAPEVVGSGRWEVRCAQVGEITGVVIREGVHSGEGVLSWTGVAKP
jgi:hypothetical protein